MKDRIRLIMQRENLTPSEFADKLQIGRAVISHILNDRNKPSLDVVTNILTQMNYINSDWLLSGTGEMYKENSREINNFNKQLDERSADKKPDLFSQSYISPPDDSNRTEYRKEILVEPSRNTIKEPVKQQTIPSKTIDRKVSKIIIYYNDNTFEIFNTDNSPL